MVKDLDYLFKRLNDISKAVNCLRRCLQAMQAEREKVEPKEVKELKKRLKKHEGLRLFPYKCVEENTLVLMADLSWKRIADIEVGEKILTLQEQGDFLGVKQVGKFSIPQYAGRSWVVAEVINKAIDEKECCKLITEHGELIATPDHFVMATKSGRSRSKKWRKISEIYACGARERRSSYIAFLFNPWPKVSNWETGYIAGVFDGEGSLSFRQNYHFTLSFAQKNNCVLENVKNILKKYKFDYGEHITELKNNSVHHLILRGGLNEIFRFLGFFRPKRLLKKFFEIICEPNFKRLAKWTPSCVLARIPTQFIGKRKVVDITTTAGTFIANGFFVHNCPTGHLTIGYGHNLEAKGITPDVAEILLEKDMQDAFYDLKKLPEESWKHLNLRRQCVLVEMIFNMGVTKVLKFKHMLKALAEKDYKRAAEEMLDSRWAEQVGERAKTLAKIMEEG